MLHKIDFTNSTTGNSHTTYVDSNNIEDVKQYAFATCNSLACEYSMEKLHYCLLYNQIESTTQPSIL